MASSHIIGPLTGQLFFYCYNCLGDKRGMQRVHNMEYSSAVPPGSNMQVGALRHPPECIYIISSMSEAALFSKKLLVLIFDFFYSILC